MMGKTPFKSLHNASSMCYGWGSSLPALQSGCPLPHQALGRTMIMHSGPKSVCRKAGMVDYQGKNSIWELHTSCLSWSENHLHVLFMPSIIIRTCNKGTFLDIYHQLNPSSTANVCMISAPVPTIPFPFPPKWSFLGNHCSVEIRVNPQAQVLRVVTVFFCSCAKICPL